MQELLTNPLILILIQLWTVPWKGLALWTAANKKQKMWFVALLVIQTLGILEIIYLVFIAKYDFQKLLQSLKKGTKK